MTSRDGIVIVTTIDGIDEFEGTSKEGGVFEEFLFEIWREGGFRSTLREFREIDDEPVLCAEKGL